MTLRPDETCVEHGRELMQLMYGGLSAPSTELRSHLADCNACREALAGGLEAVESLRVALTPEPLPPSLRRKIADELDARQAVIRFPWSRTLRVAGAAVAAGLLAAAMIPRGQWSTAPPAHAPGAATVQLSGEDVAAIATACALVGWDSPADYSVDVLAERVDDVARAVRREAGATTLLPWDPEDDWDVPVQTPGTSALNRPYT